MCPPTCMDIRKIDEICHVIFFYHDFGKYVCFRKKIKFKQPSTSKKKSYEKMLRNVQAKSFKTIISAE